VKTRTGRDEPKTAGQANRDPDQSSFRFDYETVHECSSSMRALAARGPFKTQHKFWASAQPPARRRLFRTPRWYWSRS